MLNDLDRYHLVIDVIDRVPGLAVAGRPRPAADGRPAARGAGLHPARGRGPAGDPRLDLAGLTRPAWTRGSSSSTRGRAASSSGSSTPTDAVVGVGATLPTRSGSPRTRRSCAEAIARARGGRRRRPPGRPRRRRGSPAPVALVDEASLAALEALTALAPLHQPRSLAAIARGRGGAARTCPQSPASTPRSTRRSRRPRRPTRSRREWRERWALRRFGFHGLSHAYASRRAAELLGPAGRPGAAGRDLPPRRGRVAGGRAAAGRSVDTTMGFTPLEGLVMATRSGTVDPGLVLWLRPSTAALPAERGRGRPRARGPASLGPRGHGRHARGPRARPACGDADAALALDVYVHRLRAGDRGDGGRRWAASTRSCSPAASASGRADGPRAAAVDGLGFLGVGARPGAERRRRRPTRPRTIGARRRAGRARS